MLREFGKTARQLGKTIDKWGQSMEVQGAGVSYVERLVPSTRVLSANGQTPQISEAAFVAPNASVIGNVELSSGASVWYGAIVKGDNGAIKIGENSAVQDRAEVDETCTIGSGVTIAPAASLAGCTIEDNVFIGTGAKILSGVKVQSNSMVGAGAVITSGQVVETGSYWAGNPASFVRELSAEEMESIELASAEAFELAYIHEVEASKSFEEIEADKEALKDLAERDPTYHGPPNPNLAPERKGLIFSQ